MDEAQLMYSFNSKNTLSDVETRHILRECVVFDQHGHKVTTRQELHDQIEIRGILERVVKLYDPWRVRLGQNIALCADMGKLS